MKSVAFPSFGAELRRPVELHEVCFDCAELYHGCNAWPQSKPMSRPGSTRLLCGDCLPLPPVGIDGATGQEFPPSRMNGRKEPRERQSIPVDINAQECAGSRSNQRSRQPSPAGVPGSDGKRLCTCGAALPQRKRCCDACRATRRHQTLHGRNRRLTLA